MNGALWYTEWLTVAWSSPQTIKILIGITTLTISNLFHTMAFFAVLSKTGPVFSALLKAIQTICVFILSSIFFCSADGIQTQCATIGKALAVVVLTSGLAVYGLGAQEKGREEARSFKELPLPIMKTEVPLRGGSHRQSTAVEHFRRGSVTSTCKPSFEEKEVHDQVRDQLQDQVQCLERKGHEPASRDGSSLSSSLESLRASLPCRCEKCQDTSASREHVEDWDSKVAQLEVGTLKRFLKGSKMDVGKAAHVLTGSLVWRSSSPPRCRSLEPPRAQKSVSILICLYCLYVGRCRG